MDEKRPKCIHRIIFQYSEKNINMITGIDSYRGKNDIIRSLLPLAGDLRHVRIDRDKISEFCAPIRRKHLVSPQWDQKFIFSGRDEIGVDYFMLMNALNFSYWGEPRWTVEFEDRLLDGAFGMFAALNRAVDDGIPIWEGAFLAGIGPTELADIFRGKGTIPLFNQRLTICREIGSVLTRHFEGRFYHLVERSEGSAVRMVRLLVSHFPSFNDASEWEGEPILFYKRAQLAPAMLFERWEGAGPGSFSDLDQMTVSADYKIPQVLRKLGIITYSDQLKRLVDSRRIIPVNSREELEIRVSTILAAELILKGLQTKFPKITSQNVDRMLWLIGQQKSPDDKPYHRTRTIAY